MKPDVEAQIRSYAAGETSWDLLKEKGFKSYMTVLARLHELGLRPPTAPVALQGPGLRALKEALAAHPEEAPAR